jgi:exonuclease III
MRLTTSPRKTHDVRNPNMWPRNDGSNGIDQCNVCKRINYMKISTWNVRILYRAGAMDELAQELEKYKIVICALQEIRWPGERTIAKKNYMILYCGNKNGKHEFCTGFYVNRRIMDNITDFEPANDRICKIRVKLKFYNLTMISIHIPTEEKEDLVKEQFCMSLEKSRDTIPNYDMKVILGDFNAKIGKENYWYPACRRYSLHDKTNDNSRLCSRERSSSDWNMVST